MSVIDFRVRPPAKGFLGTTMYTASVRRDGLTRAFGLPPARSAQEQSMALLLAEMERADVSLGVVTARLSDYFGSVSNEDVLDIVRDYSPRFAGVAAVDPTHRRTAIAQIESSLAAGFKAINIEPGAYPVPLYADDRSLYPLYACCEDLGIPAIIMAGGNAGPDLAYSCPVHLDRVAADFPRLRIVVSHGGWPWVHEILHVAFRRGNVYICPDMYLRNMAGMDDYVRAANGFLAERFLYASGYPFCPVEEYAAWFQTLPLRPEVLERVLYRNAAELLGLA